MRAVIFYSVLALLLSSKLYFEMSCDLLLLNFTIFFSSWSQPGLIYPSSLPLFLHINTQSLKKKNYTERKAVFSKVHK